MWGCGCDRCIGGTRRTLPSTNIYIFQRISAVSLEVLYNITIMMISDDKSVVAVHRDVCYHQFLMIQFTRLLHATTAMNVLLNRKCMLNRNYGYIHRGRWNFTSFFYLYISVAIVNALIQSVYRCAEGIWVAFVRNVIAACINCIPLR